MTGSKTLQARVQLKADTQANWELIESTFVPLNGELIIYSADTDGHNYSRLKVGDGYTPLSGLHFIDAGTINGEVLPQSVLAFYQNYDAFPQIGETNRLYIDLETNRIYCYTNTNGYTQLSNFTYTVSLNKTPVNVAVINSWDAGSATTATITNGILNLSIGSAPTLSRTTTSVIKDVTVG